MTTMADAEELLKRFEFDETESVLTHRQGVVLALREDGVRQSDIGEMLGTSRANISNIEQNARDNVQKARQTIRFANALTAPVQVEISPDTDIYDIPQTVYQACDEAGIEANTGSSELLQLLSDTKPGVIRGGTIQTPIRIDVAKDGAVYVREGGD